MTAKVSAGWRRVIQIKPYESETFELSVEKDVAVPGTNLVEEAAAMQEQLRLAGDKLVLARLRELGRAEETQQRVLPRSAGNVAETLTEPDDLV